jgi:hypothetical protein
VVSAADPAIAIRLPVTITVTKQPTSNKFQIRPT